jgi:putative transposase
LLLRRDASDCLDGILILRRRHLEQVLRVYTRHYNEHRPHRALRLAPPSGGNNVPVDHTSDASTVRCSDLLGGLIHEYQRAA